MLLAVVGVVVLIVAIVALRAPKSPANHQAAATRSPTSSSATSPGTHTSAAPRTSTPVSPSTTPSIVPTTAQLKKDVPLIVLNNTTTQGLAADAAQSFEQGGWTVTSTGNLVNNILSTCAYYDPSVAHAQAAAQALQRQFPGIVRVEPRFDGLNPGPVVVVLTTGYSTG